MKEPRDWKIDPLLEPNASIALFISIEGLQENALHLFFIHVKWMESPHVRSKWPKTSSNWFFFRVTNDAAIWGDPNKLLFSFPQTARSDKLWRSRVRSGEMEGNQFARLRPWTLFPSRARGRRQKLLQPQAEAFAWHASMWGLQTRRLLQNQIMRWLDYPSRLLLVSTLAKIRLK
jgi:hypothetical protein